MQEKHFISEVRIRKRYGHLSGTGFKRWARDPELTFPKPILIRNRRYYDLAEIEDFERRCRADGSACEAA